MRASPSGVGLNCMLASSFTAYPRSSCAAGQYGWAGLGWWTFSKWHGPPSLQGMPRHSCYLCNSKPGHPPASGCGPPLWRPCQCHTPPSWQSGRAPSGVAAAALCPAAMGTRALIGSPNVCGSTLLSTTGAGNCAAFTGSPPCSSACLLEVDGRRHEVLALLEHGQRVLAAPRLVAIHLQKVTLRARGNRGNTSISSRQAHVLVQSAKRIGQQAMCHTACDALGCRTHLCDHKPRGCKALPSNVDGHARLLALRIPRAAAAEECSASMREEHGAVTGKTPTAGQRLAMLLQRYPIRAFMHSTRNMPECSISKLPPSSHARKWRTMNSNSASFSRSPPGYGLSGWMGGWAWGQVCAGQLRIPRIISRCRVQRSPVSRIRNTMPAQLIVRPPCHAPPLTPCHRGHLALAI